MRNAQSTFAVDVRTDSAPDGAPGDATLTIVLHGELDITSSPLLQTVVEQAVAGRRKPRCRHLIVDMSGVRFADASGISPLLLARATLARRGGRIELRHCRRGVLRLLRLLDLDDMVSPNGDAPA